MRILSWVMICSDWRIRKISETSSSEKIDEAIPLHNALKELYESLTDALAKDPPPEIRSGLWQSARETLQHWINKEYSAVKIQKFIGKISNGLDY